MINIYQCIYQIQCSVQWLPLVSDNYLSLLVIRQVNVLNYSGIVQRNRILIYETYLINHAEQPFWI